MFATPEEANRFLLEKIISQAQDDGVELTDTEVHELRTPDCGHTVDEDQSIDESFPPGYSHWALRKNAARQLRRAFSKAKASDPEVAASFKAAYRGLSGSRFLLGNLTHADAPVLEAVDRLHLEPLFDLFQGLLGLLSPFSTVPPIASHRPVVVGTLLLVGSLLLGCLIALLTLSWFSGNTS